MACLSRCRWTSSEAALRGSRCSVLERGGNAGTADRLARQAHELGNGRCWPGRRDSADHRRAIELRLSASLGRIAPGVRGEDDEARLRGFHAQTDVARLRVISPLQLSTTTKSILIAR